ncbi:hypothetical protein AY601_0284 [Pedobacter cryoconitis]|uniref:DUF3828 domain-containing protein n=1 Tax=Pedobacter cryoconitis TaxID=188932 RepID=A0A127V7E8_9SPHI|nr:hypothetical protein [Pedobacter cryoconitis]AMP97251.1 hypothetical protein AY601_0284 [Pedobacter cryoconitis]
MLRRKTIVLVIICLIFTIKVNGQTTCKIMPDSLGKDLAAAFLNQEDLSQLSIFPNAPSAAPLLINAWNKLLNKAKNKEITPANTTFYNSYFSTNQVLDNSQTPDRLTLYVTFKHAADTLAIKLDLLKQDDHWLLTAVKDNFFWLKTAESNKISFEPAIGKEEPDAANSLPVYSTTHAIKDDHWITAGTCVSDPKLFVDAVLNDMAAHTPVKELPYLVSEAEFIQYFRSDILQMAGNKLKGSPGAQEKEILTNIQTLMNKHPEQYYSEILNDISSVSDYLGSTKYTISKNKSISYKIGNFDNDLYASGKISLEVTVKFEIENGEDTIQFSGYWINGKWILAELDRLSI